MTSRQLSSAPRRSPAGTSTPRSGRRGRKAAKDSTNPVYGVPVPESLHEAIEVERDNLAKAESILGCLAISMEYDTDPVAGPYYPHVAQIARELVRQSIRRLDSLELQKLLLRNRIKEGPSLCSYLPAAQAAAPLAIALLS